MTPQTANQINTPQVGRVETYLTSQCLECGRLNDEIADLKAKLEAAQKACGAVLHSIRRDGMVVDHSDEVQLLLNVVGERRTDRDAQKMLQHSLQMLNRAEVAEKACAEMRDALSAIGQCPACGGDGVFHPECQSCLSGEGNCTCANEPAEKCPVCEGNEKAIYDRVKQAISSDCGKDFVSKAQVAPLVEAAKMAADWFETGPADFQKAAEEIVPALEQALAHAKKIGL